MFQGDGAQNVLLRHTTCKTYDRMTHNVTTGYWRAGQNAGIFILTSEMYSLCQITYKSTYNMKKYTMTHNVMVGY